MLRSQYWLHKVQGLFFSPEVPWSKCGYLLAAVGMDHCCPHVFQVDGLDVVSFLPLSKGLKLFGQGENIDDGDLLVLVAEENHHLSCIKDMPLGACKIHNITFGAVAILHPCMIAVGKHFPQLSKKWQPGQEVSFHMAWE